MKKRQQYFLLPPVSQVSEQAVPSPSLSRPVSEAHRFTLSPTTPSRFFTRAAIALILAITILFPALLFLHQMPLLLDTATSLFVLALAAISIAFYGGSLAAGISVAGILLLLMLAPYSNYPLTTARILWLVEAIGLGGSMVWLGCRLRFLEEGHARYRSDRTHWVTTLEDFQNRQRYYLREMLTQMTNGRLRLCDAQKDLPASLPFAPEEAPVSLASATLGDIRERIRKAARFACLSEQAMEELVIAGSEAALNAVVHAAGGIAEIRASKESGIVQIWISDTGPGIDDTLLHRATLEPGFSSKGTLGQGFALMLHTGKCIYLLTGQTGTVVVIEAADREIPLTISSGTFS